MADRSRELELLENQNGVRLKVVVKPKSRSNSVEGIRANALLVHVTAAPEGGEANQALIETLAKWLGIPKSQIEITSGLKARSKRIRIWGVDRSVVEQRLTNIT